MIRIAHLEHKGSRWWVLVEQDEQGWWGVHKDPFEARAQAMARARKDVYDDEMHCPATTAPPDEKESHTTGAVPTG